jgi:hypothetical protein
MEEQILILILAFIILCIIFFIIYMVSRSVSAHEEERNKMDAIKETKHKEWLEYLQKEEDFKKTKSGKEATRKDGHKVFVGKDANNFYMMPRFEKESIFPLGANTNIKAIPLSDIDFFQVTGDIHYETKISGGKADTGGALAGFAIAGAAGAILGDKSTEIKSEEIVHDERKTYLQYRKEGHTYSLNFVGNAADALRDLLPEKEYGVRPMAYTPVFSAAGNSSKNSASSTAIAQIEALAKLKDSGVLTQEEFDTKKAELLKKI